MHGERIYTLVDLIKAFLFKINFILARTGKVPLSSDIAILKGNRAAAAISLGNFLYFPLVMWNRDKTKNFDFRQDLPITSDIDIFFRIFCTDGKLMLLNLPLAEYRRHVKSLSGDPEKKLSRLTEESNTYFNCSNLLKWHKSPIIKIIGRLELRKIERGTTWLDTGTPSGLLNAGRFVELHQERQGLMIGSPDEVAWRLGLIETTQMRMNAKTFSGSDYGKNLLRLI